MLVSTNIAQNRGFKICVNLVFKNTDAETQDNARCLRPFAPLTKKFVSIYITHTGSHYRLYLQF